MRALFARPWLDLFRGLDHCLDRGARGLVWVALGLAAGYWLYVPLHELLHAFACLATGGSVTRLEVAPLFGGGLLARVFPWVVPGGEYAGRLSGFDTGGSDLVYLATDLGPFLLALWPGVWLLRWAARRRHAALYGASLPFALAPFLSLTGDAYEIGSILATRLPPWSEPATRALLRGDDLLRKVPELAELESAPWVGLALAAMLGILWAFAWCALAGWIAGRLGQGPIEAASTADPEVAASAGWPA